MQLSSKARKLRILLPLLAVAATASVAGADQRDIMTKSEALALEQKLFTAMIAADIHSLDTLTAPDFVYNHGDAHTDTKAEMLQRMSSGIARFSRIERSTTASAPHDRETLVLTNPDTLVITGKVDFVVSMFQGPEQTARDRLTTVWMRTPAGWALVLWHATPFPDKKMQGTR